MLPYNSLLMNTFLWMPNFWEIYAVQTPFTESSWFSLNQLDMPFQAHFLLEAVRGGVSFLPATGIPKLHHLWEATGRLGNKTVLPVQLPISLKCNLKGLLRNFSNSGGGRSAIWPPIKTTEGSSLWKTEGTFFSLKSILRCRLLTQCRLISWGPDKSVLLITPIYLMRLSPPLSKNGKSQGEPVKNQTEPYLTEVFIIRKGLNAPTEISVNIKKVEEFYYFIAFWKQRGCQQKLAKCIYKPGGYVYQQVIVFAIIRCVCKRSICTWSCTGVQDVPQRQTLSPASGRV